RGESRSSVRPGLSTGLLDKTHIGQGRSALDGLEHVIEREPGDRDRGERLHLHAGARARRDRGLDLDRVLTENELDRGVREWQRVGEWNEVARALRGHDS